MANARAWRDAITRDEWNELLRVSDGRGALQVALNWGLVGAFLALVAWAPNPVTVLVALFGIGARQLGFAVLMHEAAHRTLFRSRRVNDWVGNWLCAYPVWADLHPYRPYHLKHHAKNWTEEDPDLDLATKFPVTRESMGRKVWRDLSGQIAWKRVKAILRRDLRGTFGKTGRGVTFGKTATPGQPGLHNLVGVAVTNAVLFGILAALGHPLLYLVWAAAWFTTYSLVTRIRSIAEHSMVPDRGDDMRNTRTTLARWWERLFIAPLRVNFHLEHHLAMTVPLYHLPRMHRILRERGILDGALVAPGYLSVLRQAASKPSA